MPGEVLSHHNIHEGSGKSVDHHLKLLTHINIVTKNLLKYLAILYKSSVLMGYGFKDIWMELRNSEV